MNNLYFFSKYVVDIMNIMLFFGSNERLPDGMHTARIARACCGYGLIYVLCRVQMNRRIILEG